MRFIFSVNVLMEKKMFLCKCIFLMGNDYSEILDVSLFGNSVQACWFILFFILLLSENLKSL